MRVLRPSVLVAILAMAMLAPAAAQAACPCTVFGPSDAPLGGAIQDQPLEIGMKLRSDDDGYITALRFYKQSNNTGTHVGHLWSSSGQQLAEVQFSSETASGWQEETLPVPVAITKNTTYVASYHSSAGFFGFDPGYFSTAVDRPPLHGLVNGADGGNGVYSYGATSSFPTSSWNSTNYWVDAVFAQLAPPDTRPPKVSATSPTDAATGVAASAKVTATFDEPMDPSTINAGSITLSDAANNPVVSSVSYDSQTRTATLTPQSQLAYGKTYTATVKSGQSGAADVAGNKIAADTSWSFSTAAACPCTVFASTDAPTGNATLDQPLEIGMKFRSTEDGFITSLRFYKQSNNVGTHIGHLWSGTGQLLANATFTNETASGWQQVDLPNPIQITKDTTYVASYYSSAGYYPFTPGYFKTGVDRAPMKGLANGVDGPNGVYHYGASAFPDATYNATNYWVDASFDRTIPPDTRPPSVISSSPASGASDVSTAADVSATFDEALNPATVTSTNFTLRDPQGNAVTATVSYDEQTKTAKLDPQAALAYDTIYTARLKGGSGGVADVAGNPIPADKTWSFNTAAQSAGDGPGGPVLVVTNPGDQFSHYYAEILRGEGLNDFSVADGPVTSALLTGKQVVLLATASVTDAEVSTLTSWVQGGGNLIAMRPDKKLAGLLGLTDAASTLTNGYVKVDNGTAAGAGVDGQTLQFHGTADRYTLSGASALATLYSTQTSSTSNPAVSLRDLGTSGGQAAAFAYDLARSVVYTRQGNPAWAGQKRDGTANGIRADDLFYGAKAGDVQPDWVDPNRIAVPQADEQQRLLANLITQMNLDQAPLPRFWYLPRGEKAAVVMTGDDHAVGGTTAYFNRMKAMSPAGCSVADWECVRATSYMYPDTPMTDAQAAAFQTDGFELGLHLNTGQCADFTPTSLEENFSAQLGLFGASWPSLVAPRTNRTHCIVWSDWATEPKVERAHGIRFDTNYYYNGPPGWLTQPGLMTGSGFPQRFADLDGSIIDVYQAMTQVTDESELSDPLQIHTLLDNALGSKAYYGVFTMNLHTDYGDNNNANNVVADAVDRGVPVVSSAQMLDWLDGRNGSSFGDIAYSGGQLSFTVSASSKARGLQAMLPGLSGPLSKLKRDGQSISWSKRTVKGVDYVVFNAASGSYVATYANDTTAPDISGVTATPDAEGRATVAWQTDEPSSSVVQYGRTTTLGSQVAQTALVTDHSVELTGLQPATTYFFRVTSADSAGNSATSPATSGSPASFTTPPGGLVDTRTAEFAAGTQAGTYTGATLDGTDGEVELQPTIGEEFEGTTVPSGWTSSPWFGGGFAAVANGALTSDGSTTYPPTLYDGPRVLEFSATFQPVNDQAVGFGYDLGDFPGAAFTTGLNGDPFQIYAWSGSDPSNEHTTAVPGVNLAYPHRFRIEWNAANVRFYVDGTLVATHNGTIAGPMRPVVSDYRAFGAGVHVQWLRQGTYATSGTFTSRVLDSGPAASKWQTLTAQTTIPTGTAIAYDTRSGATPQPDGTWSAWQVLGSGGAIASPNARYIQYRARMTSTGGATPILGRVSVSFGAGSDHAPVPGSVAISPSSPTTNQTVTATPSGFSDPDGDPLTYHYQWSRNGTPISGATASTLNLAQAGNGDHGDDVRVDVYATDGKGAASDSVFKTVTVANTAPTAGTVTIKPTSPSTNDVAQAVPSGYADADGDTLSYTYQWYRNGTAISGATNRTLDLSQPNNGDFGDTIAVDVRAVDGKGGTSPAARGTTTITGTNSTPVAGTVAMSPSSPKTNQTVTATPSGFRDPDGDPLTYHYQWYRNGTAISGATSSTLDLSVAGQGDRGDTIRVDVYATDNKSAASDTINGSVTVADTAPTAGTVSIKPTSPATDDTVTAVPTGYADVDGDALTYTYQWYRNGTAINGAIGRSLNLSQAGNGDAGDQIAVDVAAMDGNGGTSPTARGTTTVGSGPSNAVASYGFEEAAGSTIVDETGGHDGTITNVTRSASGKFGRALSFNGKDSIATVPDDPALHLTTGMTLEAWVRPAGATDWRTVLLKESQGRIGYALYGNSGPNNDVPSVRTTIGTDTGVNGTTDLDPNQWTHLAATYDGTTLRLFINGTQVGSKSLPGELPSDAGPLTFGANNVWGEHFAGLIDEVRVYNRPLSAADISADMGRPVVAGTPAPPVDNSPDQIGQFTTPQAWPIVAVHSALTSDGKVVSLDGFEAALDSERTWDPITGQFTQIPSGRNLFCAGHVTIANGKLAVFGGHINAYEGLKDTNLYNPQTKTWTRGADMSVARWYPTATELPDGRVFVISGDNVTLDVPGRIIPLTSASDTLPEIYNPTTNSWTDLPSASRLIPLYPFIFVLPNGKLFDAGPDTTTRTLDLSTGQWTTVGTSPIDGMSAVMYRPGKILKSGTWSDPEFEGRPVTNRAAAIDMTAASPAWREVAPMHYGRSYHTLTVLPDGKVLASGGQNGTDGVDETTGVLATEIWDPDTDTWTQTASSRRPRLYHSTSLLLPDGRVMLAGGGAFGNAHNEKSAEIYSPPYLFKGTRPTVTSAPTAVHYGQSFTVGTPDAAKIKSVSLIRMGSVTHDFDQDQRFMNLTMSAGSSSVNITGPTNANYAPPGSYMVFLVDDKGVPSMGQIVQVSAASGGTQTLSARTSTGQRTTSPTTSDSSAPSSSTDAPATSSPSGTTDSTQPSSGSTQTSSGSTQTSPAPTTTAPAAEGGDATTTSPSATDGTTSGSSAPTPDASGTPAPAAGPAAAFGFEESSGSTATDSAGGHDGEITGATRTTGRFGQGLSFDGVDDVVTVPHDAALSPTDGLTVEAWVKPSALGDWRSVVTKERAADALVYALYANSDLDRPTARLFTTSDLGMSGDDPLPTDTWSHLAMTWDGTMLRLYVDGKEVASRLVVGPLATGDGPLRLGANGVSGQSFAGSMDEVRIYDRSLTPTEIDTDMNTAVKP
jgi:hypothetical protein